MHQWSLLSWRSGYLLQARSADGVPSPFMVQLTDGRGKRRMKANKTYRRLTEDHGVTWPMLTLRSLACPHEERNMPLSSWESSILFCC
jgi:hypothetical protein